MQIVNNRLNSAWISHKYVTLTERLLCSSFNLVCYYQKVIKAFRQQHLISPAWCRTTVRNHKMNFTCFLLHSLLFHASFFFKANALFSLAVAVWLCTSTLSHNVSLQTTVSAINTWVSDCPPWPSIILIHVLPGCVLYTWHITMCWQINLWELNGTRNNVTHYNVKHTEKKQFQ